jgi:hypothetical protein
MSTSEPQSYVDRLFAILTAEERIRANTLIGDAVLRHNLDADFDANHPVLGVISEVVFHCEIFDRTAVRTQRLLEDVRDESQRLTKTVRELEKFANTSVARIKEAEENAFANIHQPRHVFEQKLMDEYKELKRGFVKETEELRKAAAKTRSEIESLGRARTPKWKVAVLMLIALVFGMAGQSFISSGGRAALSGVSRPPLTTIQ